MKECVTDFSILRIFFETANFILQNAYMANFEERAERLAAFWSQFSKNKHSKPPQIGISTFQTKESEIKILYANNFHTLNTKTGEVLLKLLKANINGRILQKNKLPTFENCDEIADELGKMKWLENAVMEESNGLNMKGIYEKILEEFDNRRHNQYSAERSFGMACSAEFFNKQRKKGENDEIEDGETDGRRGRHQRGKVTGDEQEAEATAKTTQQCQHTHQGIMTNTMRQRTMAMDM
ncbi:hypothetical protein niasHT_029592 [Heterodera trifolii]|uniref:Uncharacterized protein n=1 Tax=Heterodera trifolii TaxID=157864 RepID=A0ABD2K2Z8_9BILA